MIKKKKKSSVPEVSEFWGMSGFVSLTRCIRSVSVRGDGYQREAAFAATWMQITGEREGEAEQRRVVAAAAR